MILMTTYMLQNVPFKTVYLHGLVRTRDGKKMSKSVPETCIDPLESIAERHGLDKEPIIDFDGKLLPIEQEFAGMGIDEARPKIMEKLREKGLLVNTDFGYVHSKSFNSRGGGAIEPQIR